MCVTSVLSSKVNQNCTYSMNFMQLVWCALCYGAEREKKLISVTLPRFTCLLFFSFCINSRFFFSSTQWFSCFGRGSNRYTTPCEMRQQQWVVGFSWATFIRYAWVSAMRTHGQLLHIYVNANAMHTHRRRTSPMWMTYNLLLCCGCCSHLKRQNWMNFMCDGQVLRNKRE